MPAYRLAAGRVLDWARGGYAVPEGYVASLRRAGARVAVLPPDLATPSGELLAPFAALLLAGGGDVGPDRYDGGPHHPAVYGVDAERDEAELRLARHALATGLPVLAICRGMQLLNVALGGTLHQHLPDLQGMDLHGHPTRHAPVLHDVKVEAGSRLASACGREVLRCTSHHHQGLDRLGAGLAAVAWSGDGLVEGVELAGGGWVVGVQWHPELTAAEDETQQALFDGFIGSIGFSGAGEPAR
ncbi:MAG: gamma-glutamyl-gamma-aminobutyrate hydrolase family protein [Acidimicrobiales bacterium]